MIHLLKEMNGKWVIVKCGLELLKNDREWSGWHDQVTCEECVPDLQSVAKCDSIISPGAEVRKTKKENKEMGTTQTVSFDKTLMTEVKTLREVDGMKWDAISEAMDISSGKAILIYNFATVKPKDKIKDPKPADIKRLRDVDNLSWGVLISRTGLSETALRSMYEDATGQPARGTRVGKGGRYPGESAPAEKAPAKGKKAPAKKAPAKKGAAKPTPLKGLKSAEIKTAITGFAIKHGDETIAVKEVKKANATTVVLIDADGKARTLKTAAVHAVSKKKVIK